MKLIGIVESNLDEHYVIRGMEPSERFLGRKINCPICNNELWAWNEGCTIIHLVCLKCKLRITILNTEMFSLEEIKRIRRKIEKTFYEEVM